MYRGSNFDSNFDSNFGPSYLERPTIVKCKTCVGALEAKVISGTCEDNEALHRSSMSGSNIRSMLAEYQIQDTESGKADPTRTIAAA